MGVRASEPCRERPRKFYEALGKQLIEYADAYRKATRRKPYVPPDLDFPEGLDAVWLAALDLQHPEGVSYSEIVAYEKLSGLSFKMNEVNLIRRVCVVLQRQPGDKSQGETEGMKNRTTMNDNAGLRRIFMG